MGQQTFDPRVDAIFLRAKIEGAKGRYAYVRMVLDTGASKTVVPWDVAELLGFDPARSARRVRFMTGSGMEAAPVLVVNAIEVLGVRVPDVDVICHNLPQRSLVDGLLGLSFLRQCRLSIHFGQGILTLNQI